MMYLTELHALPGHHHPVQRRFKRAGRVRQEIRHTAQRFILACIEHMQDGSDQ